MPLHGAMKDAKTGTSPNGSSPSRTRGDSGSGVRCSLAVHSRPIDASFESEAPKVATDGIMRSPADGLTSARTGCQPTFVVMIPRKAGQFVRQRFVRLFVPITLLLAVGLTLALLGWRWWPLSLLAFAVLAIEEWLQRRRDPLQWLQGARGEEAVGRVLKKLEVHGYRTLHDLETAHGNLDHVVVGPTGVFAIETKHWNGVFYPQRGQLMHNGVSAMRVVKQATRAAMEVARRLRGAGMNSYVAAFVVSTKAPVRGKTLSFQTASVLELDDLVETIRRPRGIRLSENEVARAVAAILRGDAPISVRPMD
jgi:hypothetical protein